MVATKRQESKDSLSKSEFNEFYRMRCEGATMAELSEHSGLRPEMVSEYIRAYMPELGYARLLAVGSEPSEPDFDKIASKPFMCTEAQLSQIRSLLNTNVSNKNMSSTVGMSTGKLRKVLCHYGLTHQRRTVYALNSAEWDDLIVRYRAGATMDGLAELFDIGRHAIPKRLKKEGLASKGLDWVGDAEKQEMMSLYASGEEEQALAARYGIPCVAVRRFLIKEGLTEQVYVADMSDDDKKDVAAHYGKFGESSTMVLFKVSERTLKSVLVSEGVIKPFVKVSELSTDQRRRIRNRLRAGASYPTIMKDYCVYRKELVLFAKQEGISVYNPADRTLDRDKILEMSERGLTQTEIAKMLGCGQAAVSKNMLKMGLSVRMNRSHKTKKDEFLRRYAEGEAKVDILGDMMGTKRHDSSVYNWTNADRSLSDKRFDEPVFRERYGAQPIGKLYVEAFSLRSKGHSTKEIAHKQGRSYQNVCRMLKTRHVKPSWYARLVPGVKSGELSYHDTHFLSRVPEWLFRAFMFKNGDLNAVVSFEQIAECETEGMSTAQIAAKYKCGTRTVRRYRRYWRAVK